MKTLILRPLCWSLFLVWILFSACGKPRLDGLNPDSGPPGTIVEVTGSNQLLASVVWDAGLPGETVLPSSFLSSRYFTVPLGATAGDHPVRLKRGDLWSDNTLNFTVSGSILRPAPRIDYVTCYQFNINNAGEASFFLMLSGANFDVGAQIRINGVVQPAFVSSIIRNDMNGSANPATLGYPIPTYAMLWTYLAEQSPGRNITVQVSNLDGVLSNNVTYTIASSMATLDSDGDGLLDDWEINGYDANGDGTTDVDLPGLGANVHHKDLFVEVDWMTGFAPNNAIWATIETAFANAPILNADGTPGIAIHIDRGQAGAGGGGSAIAATNFIRFDNNMAPGQGAGSTVNFYTVKNGNFNANRLRVYRYCIFADDSGHSPGSSGQAESIWGNDFYVSLGAFPTPGGTVNQQIGTFIHELGHTLNLYHGGNENINRKPPYNSVMRYGSPGQFPGIDNNCNNAGDAVYTYSQGMRASLNENNLNETLGVCDNNGVDWNNNGTMQNGVSADINGDGLRGVLNDFADWGMLRLNFTMAGSNWGSN